MYIAGTFLQQVHEGQACNIDLVSDGLTPDYHLHALARVVRKDEQGVALEFTSMPYESYMMLQAALLNETCLASNKKILGETCPFELAEDVTLPQ